MTFDPNSRYKDRLEPSAPIYNNPYRQDNDAARGYARLHVQVGREKDRYESRQVRLERDMLEKFQRSEFKVSSAHLALAVQIGRMLLLAIFLPPVMIFYTAPKWIFAQIASPLDRGLEKAIEGMQKMWMALSQATQNLWQISLSLVKKLYSSKKTKEKTRHGENVFQIIYKELKITTQRYKASFAEAFQKASEKFKHLAFNFQKMASQFVTFSHAHVLKWTSQARSILQKGTALAKQPFIAAYEKGKLIIKEYKEKFFPPLQRAREKAKAAFSFVAEKGKETFKYVHQHLSHAFQKVQTTATYFKPRLPSFEPVKQVVQQALQITVRSLEVMRNAFAPLYFAAKNQTAIQIERMMNWNAKVLNNTLQLGNRIVQYAKSKGGELLQQGKQSFKQMAQLCKAVLKAAAAWSRDWASRKFARHIRWLAALLRFLRVLWERIVEFLKELPDRFRTWTNAVAAKTIHYSKQTLWGLRMAATWLKVYLNYHANAVVAWLRE
jgi:hypothetical protein